MSFLTEVISSAQEYDTQQLVEKLPKVSSEVDIFKETVKKYLEGVYVKFEEQRKNASLFHQSTKLKTDLVQLSQIADELVKKDLVTTSVDLCNIKTNLEKTTATLHITKQLIAVHEALQNAASLRLQKGYVECMKLLTGTHNCLESIPKGERVRAVDKMITMIDAEKALLLREVGTALESNLVIDTSSDEKSLLKVSKDSEELITKSLLVFELWGDCITPLTTVINFLWNNVFVPIVDNGAVVEVSEVDDFHALIVTLPEKPRKASYAETFDNIKKVLSFLCDHVNFPLEKHKSSLNYIGGDLRDNLSELLIKNCLQKAIPSTVEGLEKFKAVINHTEELQKQLVQAGIFPEDFIPLVEYVRNVDTLFINKKCQEYIAEALVFMKKDLHDMTEIGEPHDATNPLGDLLEANFPKCAVSKSCIAILQLVEQLLQQYLSANDVFAERVICTIQKIFYTYRSVVPEYHKKLLETIPQQVALFHNNCLYIAHKLTEWNEIYRTKLSPTLLIGSTLFVDQPHLLRTTGSDIFSSYVKQQITQVESIMEGSGLYALQTAEELPPTIEKAVRQCIRQQELLKTVWQKVLSYQIYNKTIGVIMNSLCTCLINAVLKLEDIPSTLDEQLIDVYKVVITRGPKLFTDPKEICLFVSNWNKFNELIFVLNASLVDIDDRWSNGKGPLALQFQAEEVRKLIRALFQNTSRRANVLSKICDL